MGERWIWNLYRRILYFLRGVISMIHLHKMIHIHNRIMSIAPPPETDLNDLIKFEEGAQRHLPLNEEGVSL